MAIYAKKSLDDFKQFEMKSSPIIYTQYFLQSNKLDALVILISPISAIFIFVYLVILCVNLYFKSSADFMWFCTMFRPVIVNFSGNDDQVGLIVS